MQIKVQGASSLSFVSQKVEDYKQLVKFKLTLTVVFTSCMAYILALQGAIHWGTLTALGLGGFLVTAAANALNQVLEKDFDKLMTRTAGRPLAAGRMSISEAVLLAGFMSLVGIIVLSLLHPLAGFFGMISLVSYAFIYTPVKRISPVAVAIGAVPGAMPMLIGAVVAEGMVTPFGLALYAIQFFWQFPHFWAIGWLGFEDYQKAGYKLLPSIDGQRDRNTGLQSFIYAGVLVMLSFLFWMIDKTTLTGSLLMALMAGYYTWTGWQLYRHNSREAARTLMFTSFAYLPVVLLVMLFEKLLN